MGLILLASGAVHAQVPTFVFVSHAGVTAEVRGFGLAVDSMQNVLVTGFFAGTAAFGTNNLIGAGGEDVFVAKYDAKGSLLWAAQAGGTNDDVGSAVGVDGAGNCYVTGFFNGTASFGGTNVLSSGTGPSSGGAFVAKYDPSGSLVWVRGTSNALAAGIAVDPSGNSYVTGSFGGKVSFGGITLTTGGSPPVVNIFLAKYDADGNVVWATQAGGSQPQEQDSGVAVTLDDQGNVFLAGLLGTDFGSAESYFAKYDAGGNLVWDGGGSRYSLGTGVAADGAGNLFTAGQFAGRVTFSGVTLSSEGLQDAVIAKYDSAGDLLWVRQLGGSNSVNSAKGVTTDALGNCYLSGEFTKSLTTGLTNLTAVGPQDAFICKYDPNGNLSWIFQLGASEVDFVLGLASFPGLGIYATGSFSPGTKFGSISVDNSGPDDFFLTRIDEMPVLSVTNTASNVLLSWPTNQLGFVLEWTASLTPPFAWSTNTNPIQVSGDHYTVTDQLSAAAGFYRLSKP